VSIDGSSRNITLEEKITLYKLALAKKLGNYSGFGFKGSRFKGLTE
jgi:hypothetical protein